MSTAAAKTSHDCYLFIGDLLCFSTSTLTELRRFKEKIKMAPKNESDADDVNESVIDCGVELLQRVTSADKTE